MTIEVFIIILVTFVLSSLIKGWTGFGTNLIAMPLLATFLNYSLPDSVTIVITINIFMNIAILVENKKFNIYALLNIWLLALTGIVFTIVGAYFMQNPNNQTILKIIVGIVIVLTGLYQIYRQVFEVKNIFKREDITKYFIPVGIISGIMNGIAGLGGLPVLILLSNTEMDKDDFRSTLVSYFLLMNVVAIVGYSISGNYTPFVLTHIGYFLIPSVIACMIGVYISRRVSDKVFRNVVIGVLIFMGLNLLINGITGSNIISIFINML